MDDLLKKITDSAEKIKPPKELEPEQIIEKAEQEAKKRRRSKHIHIAQFAAAAAVLVLCSCTIFYMGGIKYRQEKTVSFKEELKNGLVEEQEAEKKEAGKQSNILNEQEAKETIKQKEVRNNAGDLYKVAKNYSEVRNIVSQEFMEQQKYGNYIFDGSISGSSGAGRYEESGMQYSGIQENEGTDALQNVAESLSTESVNEYSTTNLQTQGVDESDIIKTDGKYIYTLNNDVITIVDIQNGGLEETATISLKKPGRELYIDNNHLIVIIQEEISEMHENGNSVPGIDSNNKNEVEIKEGNGMIPLQEAEKESSKQESNKQESSKQEDYSVENCFVDEAIDVIYMDTKIITTLQTYDITNRSQPELIGEVEQEGRYYTSRKIGDIVYLFTNKSLEMYAQPMYDNTKEQAREEEITGVREEDTTGVPKVNGQVIASDSIYLPQRGNQGLIISSVNLQNPDSIVDNVMIVNNYVDIYVTSQSLYLYHSEYQSIFDGQTTQIAKFQLKDGFINAVAAANAAGVVTDTFAINEAEDYLRLLTTCYSYQAGKENKNCLYIFDNQMQLLGKLDDIAPGEEIYAARYLKDMAYFITYHNTDPLFAADLSNPAQPKLLGEVEITGFSDYLHFWQDNMLLGIGYETDPENGKREGLKLTMFDITDPVNLKIVTTKVIKGVTYSPALENYKYIFADTRKNIIGVTSADYQEGKPKYKYQLFTWTPDEFQNLLTVEYPKTVDMSNCRGLYSGNTFYLAMPSEITAYDMENGYQEIAHLEFGKQE